MELEAATIINETFNKTRENEGNFERYSVSYTILAVFSVIFILVMGFVGNILVIIVVIKRRSMHTTTNCYLLSLALADLLLLLSATLPATAEPFYRRYEWPWGHILCSLAVFAQYLGANASALSITAFTIERYIAICHPMKAQIICTTERAKKIIFGLWCFAILYCAPWLGLSVIHIEINEKREQLPVCGYRLERQQYVVYYVIDLFIFYIIPLLMTAVLYSFIVHMLYNTTIYCSRRKTCIEDRKKSSASSRQQVVKMLIVIVAVFCIMWLPYRSVVVYNSFSDDEDGIKDAWFWLVCRIMVYTNSAINPILYNAMSVKFREAFFSILCHRQLAKQRCRRYSKSIGVHGQINLKLMQQYSLMTSNTGHVIQIENNELYELNDKLSNEDRCSSCLNVNGYLSDSDKRLNGSV